MTEQNLVPAHTFEDRMKERIRDSIGELLSDEDLEKLVKRGVEEVFFKPRYQGRGYNQQELPPLIHEVVRDELGKRMETAVDAWLKTHGDEVLVAIRDAIQEGAGNMMVKALNQWMEQAMWDLQGRVVDRLRQGMS